MESNHIRLTADGGGTKTTWLAECGECAGTVTVTPGINPFHQSAGEISDIIKAGLTARPGFPAAETVSEVRFYGAGCAVDGAAVVRRALEGVFPNAAIEVDSDMLGAAKALFGGREGIACILGTGANSCLFDGEKIVSNVPPLGYILGDEGGGAVLGRNLINAIYKGGHADFAPVFEKETGLTLSEVVRRVYREPVPNRFLASFAPFVRRHMGEPWVAELVADNFRQFFRKNTAHYRRPDLECAFVGGVAYAFGDTLRRVAREEGVRIGEIRREPLV